MTLRPAPSVLCCLLLGLFGLLWIAVEVLPPLAETDLAVVRHVHDLTGEPFVGWARELTSLGRMEWIFALTGLAMAVLIVRGHRHEAVALGIAVASSQLAVAAVKNLMLRERPPSVHAVFEAGGHSFPSGHAATSFALFATVAFLLSRGRSRGARVAIWTALAPLALGVGLTRLYLGVHYPSDIAAGWLLAAACATAAWAACTAVASRRAGVAPRIA